MAKRILLFLLLNFAALAIGGYFTGSGVVSDWYQSLNQAPWTPPGWVFGAAWSTIMLCFGFYMAVLYKKAKNRKLLIMLFSIQWILNVLWNPVFFYFQNVALGLVVIVALTLLILLLLLWYRKTLSWTTLLILPYFIWLLIATSLNGYIYWNN